MEKEKMISIQVLRALACIVVLMSHCNVGKHLGEQGVALFFILSGFLLVYRYYSQDIECSVKSNVRFAINKIKKIYPLHIATMLAAFMLFIYSLIIDFSFDKLIDYIVKTILNVFLLQAWIPDRIYYASLNTVSWYLSPTIFFYFCFPFLLMYVRKSNTKKALSSIVILMSLQFVTSLIMGMFSYEIKQWVTYIFPLYRLSDFYIGCNLGYLFINHKETNISKVKIGIIELVLIALFIIPNLSLSISDPFYQVFYRLCAIGGIYFFALNKGFLAKISFNKFSVFIGNISSYIFLIHFIFIIYLPLINKHFPIILVNNKLTYTLLVFVLSVIASIIWKRIETLFRLKKLKDA